MTQVKRKYSISTPYVFQVCQISLAEASCTGTSLAGTSLILIVGYVDVVDQHVNHKGGWQSLVMDKLRIANLRIVD